VTRPVKSIDHAQREALARLISGRRESFESISRVLGRNPAYIQQFMKRGIPRRLSEEDRGNLASYFGVDESELGGPKRPSLREGAFIQIPILDTSKRNVVQPPDRIRPIDTSSLAVFSVCDDALAPEVIRGDDVVIDRQDGFPKLRDGLYAVERDSIVSIRRIGVASVHHMMIVSGNDWSLSCPIKRPPDYLKFLGRVIWIVRRP